MREAALVLLFWMFVRLGSVYREEEEREDRACRRVWLCRSPERSSRCPAWCVARVYAAPCRICDRAAGVVSRGLEFVLWCAVSCATVVVMVCVVSVVCVGPDTPVRLGYNCTAVRRARE